MNDGAGLPVSPRQAGALVLLLLGLGVFVLGLFAVGPGGYYLGDTWPDFLVILAASLLIVGPVIDLAAHDATGTWSWRTLRRWSVPGLGVAFVLLFVLSAAVPAQTGISPVGDSAQGLSMYVFAEALLVTLVAAARSPRGAGVSRLEWSGGSVTPGARPGVRIALRRLPLVSRPCHVDVDGSGVAVVIPRLFGGRRAWFIPMHTIGVVLPGQPGAGHRPDPLGGEGWMTREEFRTPYLSTTSTFTAPNLTLLFTVPQRIAPIRRFARHDLDLSSSATRSAAGVLVDGVELRAVDPDAARQALLASGARAVTDADAFVKQHRDVVHDPEKVRAVTAAARWSSVLGAMTLVAGIALFAAHMITDDDRWGVALAAAIGILTLVDLWVRRRAR